MKPIYLPQPGEKFGEWTVLREALRERTHVRALCRCSCGTEQIVRYTYLRHKQTLRCKNHLTNLIQVGNTYGDFKAIRHVPIKNYHARFLGECVQCQARKLIRCSSAIKSIGLRCIHPYPNTTLKIGQRIGDYTIKKIFGTSVRLQCSCGKITYNHPIRRAIQGQPPKFCQKHDLFKIKKGDTFGELTIAGPFCRKKSRYFFPVLCSCGTEFLALYPRLKNGKITRCQHHRVYRYSCGDKIGAWTLLEEPKDISRSGTVLAVCSCGIKKKILYRSLTVYLHRGYLHCRHRFNFYGESWSPERQRQRREETHKALGLSFMRVGVGEEAARVAYEFGASPNTCRRIKRKYQDGFRLAGGRGKPTLYEKYGEVNKITPEIIEKFTREVEKSYALREDEKINVLNSLLLVYASTTVETDKNYIPRLTKKWVKYAIMSRSHGNRKVISIDDNSYLIDQNTTQRYREDIYNDSLSA